MSKMKKNNKIIMMEKYNSYNNIRNKIRQWKFTKEIHIIRYNNKAHIVLIHIELQINNINIILNNIKMLINLLMIFNLNKN